MSVPPGYKDLGGLCFGQLKVLCYAGIKQYASGRKRTLWCCRCLCGKEKVVESTSLYTGNTKSCGCLQLKKATKHGHCSKGHISPEHAAWNTMLHRCGPMAKGELRKHYYERGIRVRVRWKKFKNFLADMGLRPGPGYSLNRIDNDGGYSKSNCNWSTRIEQENNKRTNRIIVYFGKRKTLAQWCRALGLPYNQTWARIMKFGWSVERAFGGSVA